jgi:hypothetical protein
MSMESNGGMIFIGKTGELAEKLFSGLLCPPHMSHGLIGSEDLEGGDRGLI